MLCKLAFRNVRKSIGDYTVYFVTLMFAVMFFYAFNSLDAQQAVMDLNENKATAAHMMVESISVFSTFVAITLAILILYANNFLIKRRNKELGVYLMLGMGKGRVASIFMLETLIVGVIALVVGLLLGVLFSQVMSIITANMFEVSLKQYVFVFSPKAAMQSIIYFGVIFLCVMIFNAARVSKQKIIKLLHADTENERAIGRKTGVSVVLTVAGIILIIIAYYLIIKGMLIMYLPLVMLFGIPGTFLLFAGLAGFTYKIASHNKKRYFKGLNLFVTRQITSKINSTHTSVALVCIMLFVTITTLGAGSGVSGAVNKETTREINFDSEYYMQPETAEAAGGAIEALKAYGIPVDRFYSQMSEYTSYESDVDVMSQFGNYFDVAEMHEMAEAQDVTMPAMAVPVSQFNSLLSLIGQAPIEVSENELGVVLYNQSMYENLQKFSQSGQKIISNEKEYTIPEGQMRLANTRIQGAASISPVILVYPDTDVINFKPEQVTIDGLYIDGQPKEVTEQAVWDFQNELKRVNPDRPYTYFTTELTSQDSSIGLRVTISFVGIYLGITFLVTAAVILALQQLSAANDNKKRYSTLRKLGTDEKMINKSLLKQIAIYFLIPLAVAAVHAIFGIKGIMSMINMMWYESVNVYIDVFMGLGIIAVIYGIYFAITYFSSKKIIREN